MMITRLGFCHSNVQLGRKLDWIRQDHLGRLGR